MVTKRTRTDSATNWAQGGIAAVLDPRGFVRGARQRHALDGRRLVPPRCVELVVRDGPSRIRELVELGAQFSLRDESESLDLTREGGHSARRVVHAGDITGEEVQRVLVEAAASSPNITIHEDHMAIDLVLSSRGGEGPRVVGAYVLDEATGEVRTCCAKAIVLATGGAGKVYLYTSNPDVATGDGIAMAYRAGAELANMEFFQFHPTCLYHPEAKSFLVSEALRGEGGVLRAADGTAFMGEHHDMKDLAPRDVVARAIDYEMKKTGAECVFLDMTHESAE